MGQHALGGAQQGRVVGWVRNERIQGGMDDSSACNTIPSQDESAGEAEQRKAKSKTFEREEGGEISLSLSSARDPVHS